MGALISDLCRNSTIKGVEISEPISIVIGIYILHHSSLYRIKFGSTKLISEYSCLFTSDSSGTIPNDLFSFCSFSILLEELWNFTEIHGTSWNCAFKMPEPIFIIISHIENKVFIGFSFIYDFFKVLR
jgi:hypothetical protein